VELGSKGYTNEGNNEITKAVLESVSVWEPLYLHGNFDVNL
jgi:hypothetical protein